MIGPDFTFDFEQRRALERLKLNHRQIDAIERQIYACATYLAPRTAATMKETRETLEALQRHLSALQRLFAYETASPAEQEALTYIGRNMDLTALSDFGLAARKNLPVIISATEAAIEEREKEGQKRDRNTTAPLHLIYRALHDYHIEASDVGAAPLDTPEKFRFYPSQPSQGSQGPFAKVADAVYITITGDGVPSRALQAFAKELRSAH